MKPEKIDILMMKLTNIADRASKIYVENQRIKNLVNVIILDLDSHGVTKNMAKKYRDELMKIYKEA